MTIAIIGAGPAGAMAALRLARAGVPATLFDPSHPREKPCGGGLTGRALALLEDVIDIRSLPSVTVRSATVEPPDAANGPIGLPPADVQLRRDNDRAAVLVIVSRAIFDRALVGVAASAGSRLVPEKVVDVRRAGSRFVVRTDRDEYEADGVIGADGPNSVVRKKLARPFLRSQLSVAAGYFVHGATSSAIAIKTMREQPGYLWSFPRPDHLAVGICTPAANRVPAPALRAQSKHWIDAHDLDAGATLSPYAWPIPSVSGRDAMDLPLGGPGWMLVGDAAGLVDPLTREGIYYALLSAQWAAEAITATSLDRAAVVYAARIKDEIGPEIACAARLSGPFFSPAFSSLLVRGLRDSAAIRDVFVDLVTGVQPYRGLRRRLLATREWGLAVGAIRLLLAPRFGSTMSTVG